MKRGQYLVLALSLIFISMLSVIPSISAYWSPFDSWSYYTPSDLLDNEWFVFALIFLGAFAFVYLSLSSVFKKEKKNKTMPWLVDVQENKGAVAVISAAVALFAASAITRQGFISGYLGEVITSWIILAVFIALIILSIPFYKSLKTSIGSGPALIAVGIIIWFILKTIQLDQIMPYSIAYEFEGIYNFLTSGITLIIIIIIGVILSIAKKRP